jgi:hypothetical protein
MHQAQYRKLMVVSKATEGGQDLKPLDSVGEQTVGGSVEGGIQETQSAQQEPQSSEQQQSELSFAEPKPIPQAQEIKKSKKESGMQSPPQSPLQTPAPTFTQPPLPGPKPASARTTRGVNPTKTVACDIGGVKCPNKPIYRHPGGSFATRCAEHKEPKMIDDRGQTAKQSGVGKPGSGSLARLMSEADKALMLKQPRCKHRGCTEDATHTFFDDPTESPLYCEQHAISKDDRAYPAPQTKPPVK